MLFSFHKYIFNPNIFSYLLSLILFITCKLKKVMSLNLFIEEKHSILMLEYALIPDKPMDSASNHPINSNINMHLSDNTAISTNIKIKHNFSIPVKDIFLMCIDRLILEDHLNYHLILPEIVSPFIEKKEDSQSLWTKMVGCHL